MKPELVNPLVLAYLGDGVFEVRTTSGDAEPLASASVMEEEKYRKHFFIIHIFT